MAELLEDRNQLNLHLYLGQLQKQQTLLKEYTGMVDVGTQKKKREDQNPQTDFSFLEMKPWDQQLKIDEILGKLCEPMEKLSMNLNPVKSKQAFNFERIYCYVEDLIEGNDPRETIDPKCKFLKFLWLDEPCSKNGQFQQQLINFWVKDGKTLDQIRMAAKNFVQTVKTS